MEENKQVVAEWKALNQPRLQEIKKANPELYSAVNLALQYLNSKLGGEELPEEVEEVEEVETQTTSSQQWTLDDFKDIKIFVNTPEKSKKFQQLFLSLGGAWSSQDVSDSDKLRQVNFTDKKYLVAVDDRLVFLDSPNSFANTKHKEIYYEDIFSDESESTESQTTTVQSEAEYTWPIETYPAKLKLPSWAFNFEKNNGNRKSPTQSAGELKRSANKLAGSTDAIYMILGTKFKGNDDNWYEINVGKGGVWTWKETTPPPTQSTSFTSTASSQPTPESGKKQWTVQDLVGKKLLWNGREYDVIRFKRNNPKYKAYIMRTASGGEIEGKLTMSAIEKLLNDEPVKGVSIVKQQTQSTSSNTFEASLTSLSDDELKQLYDDTYEARKEFSITEPEYLELSEQIVAIGDEIDNRNI